MAPVLEEVEEPIVDGVWVLKGRKLCS